MTNKTLETLKALRDEPTSYFNDGISYEDLKAIVNRIDEAIKRLELLEGG